MTGEGVIGLRVQLGGIRGVVVTAPVLLRCPGGRGQRVALNVPARHRGAARPLPDLQPLRPAASPDCPLALRAAESGLGLAPRRRSEGPAVPAGQRLARLQCAGSASSPRASPAPGAHGRRVSSAAGDTGGLPPRTGGGTVPCRPCDSFMPHGCICGSNFRFKDHYCDA